jgi:hypothetical protein
VSRGGVNVVAKAAFLILTCLACIAIGFFLPMAPVISAVIGSAFWAGVLATAGALAGMGLSDAIFTRLESPASGAPAGAAPAAHEKTRPPVWARRPYRGERVQSPPGKLTRLRRARRQPDGALQHPRARVYALSRSAHRLAAAGDLPSLPLIQADLHAPQTEAAAAIAIFIAGFSSAPIVVGPLADRFGRKAVMGVGLVLFTLSAAGSVLAPPIRVLLAFRLVHQRADLQTDPFSRLRRAAVERSADANCSEWPDELLRVAHI